MASCKILSRLSSRTQPLAQKLNKNKTPFRASPLKPISQQPTATPFRRSFSRLPLELSSLGSMMPLHSAIASARLISSLSVESKCWGLVPQGISMPL